MMIRAVRGAVQCRKDSKQEIAEKTHTLVSEILQANGISVDDIISIQLSQTCDLYELNCAAGLRRYGFANVPLFCSREPDCKGAMPRVIRVLLTCRMKDNTKSRHIYLDGAEKLRPDIANEG